MQIINYDPEWLAARLLRSAKRTAPELAGVDPGPEGPSASRMRRRPPHPWIPGSGPGRAPMRAPQFPATGNSPVGRTGARLPSRSTQTSKTPRYVGDPLICRRAAQWLACWAPNPKFCGSKPRFAMPNASATGICPRRGCAQQAIRRAQARPDILPRGKHDTKPVCPSSAHRRQRFPHLRRPR
jgi:hypothetical protein